MIWNDERIAAWASNGGVTPFDAACVNPASLDLRIGNTIREPHSMWRRMSENDMRIDIERGLMDSLPRWGDATEFDTFWLMPQRFVLCHSLELVRIPITAASILVLKSSWGRKGLNHSHSGFGDPGFGLALPQSLQKLNIVVSGGMVSSGSSDGNDGAHWTFELQNISPWPIRLAAGERVIQQVMFDMADAPAVDYRYTGHYVYQTGATMAFDSPSIVDTLNEKWLPDIPLALDASDMKWAQDKARELGFTVTAEPILDWDKAINHFDEFANAYTELEGFLGNAVKSPWRSIFEPLARRFADGERTPELYAAMMAVE